MENKFQKITRLVFGFAFGIIAGHWLGSYNADAMFGALIVVAAAIISGRFILDAAKHTTEA